jgi:hypothetical protein
MAWAIVARRALSPSTPRARGAPLRASGVDRSARPSKWLSCQQCEEAPLGLPRSIFNRHPPEVSITEICYQFRASHMGCSPVLSPMSRAAHRCAFCSRCLRVSRRTKKNPLISVFPCLSLLVSETRMIRGASLFVLVHARARSSIARAKGWRSNACVSRRPAPLISNTRSGGKRGSRSRKRPRGRLVPPPRAATPD